MIARALILKADKIARDSGLNQKQWSEKSGHAASGQTVSRILSKGDCRLSTFLELLDTINCELKIVEKCEM